METRNIQDPAADMERKITEYFGQAKCNVAVALVGRIADATITYCDYKPVRVVRKELEEQFTDITISEIHREYSREAQLQVMQELVDEDPQIFLPYEDGSLRPLCLGELLQEKLFHRTLK